jgi:hypothetical protein
MTKSRELEELIAEQAKSRAEQRALIETVDTLKRTLERPVPHRPEFKAQLRERLMAAAKAASPMPWYRRSAVWGPAVGLVAAVAVLAVGLQVYRQHPGGQTASSSPIVPSVAQPVNPHSVPITVSRTHLPMVALNDAPADDLAPEGAPNVAGGLAYYQLTVRPDRQTLVTLAQKLKLPEPGPGDPASGELRVTEGARLLFLQSDGEVVYGDKAPDSAADTALPQIEAQGAVDVALHTLHALDLPVPTLDPTVKEVAIGAVPHAFVVAYTPRVEGRPIVNAVTQVVVTDRGRVTQLAAYLPTNQELKRPSEALTVDQALQQAQAHGGASSFTTADLVYARTVDGTAIYLQPYWRVFGQSDSGSRIVRYVPALVRD